MAFEDQQEGFAAAEDEQVVSSSEAEVTPQAAESDLSESGEQEEVSAEEVEADLNALIEKAGERDQYFELAQRTQADFENYRKRAVREAAVAQQRGIAKLAAELLPAIDNLERAQQMAASGEQSDESLSKGVQLVLNEINAALERVGVTAFDPSGERFDPQLHEAMLRVPSENHESDHVVEVLQRGYRVGEQIIRPARVSVAE